MERVVFYPILMNLMDITEIGWALLEVKDERQKEKERKGQESRQSRE